MNRGSTAGFVPPSVYIGFRIFVLLERRSTTCLRCFGGYEGGLSPRRTVLLASNPARPRPATPPCAPTRPARGMSGFWTQQVKLRITSGLDPPLSAANDETHDDPPYQGLPPDSKSKKICHVCCYTRNSSLQSKIQCHRTQTLPNQKNITARKPESIQTGSECKYFARRRGVPSARR